MKKQLIELLKYKDNIELVFILGEGQKFDMNKIVNKVYPIDYLKENNYLKESTLLEQVFECLELESIKINSTNYPKEIFNLKCTKEWYLNGKRHREDGPAKEGSDGSKEWYINGQRHREDGPAIELYSGTKAWWINGELHREDGPAIIFCDGSKEWFINGEELSEEEFNKKN